MLYASFTFFFSTFILSEPAFILVLACAPFFGACLDRYLTSSSAVFYWSFPYEHNDSNRALLSNSLPKEVSADPTTFRCDWQAAGHGTEFNSSRQEFTKSKNGPVIQRERVNQVSQLRPTFTLKIKVCEWNVLYSVVVGTRCNWFIRANEKRRGASPDHSESADQEERKE